MQLTEARIREAVDSVFSDPVFQRTSLLQRLGSWLWERVRAILMGFDSGPLPDELLWFVVVPVGIVVFAMIARAGLRARWWSASGLPAVRRSRETPGGLDPWARARSFAAGGDYTAAAHSLYAAILAFIAGRGEVELHDSKTIGDYLRDLARRSSTLLSGFRDFARSYERVIYGVGSVDRDGYERLSLLARTLVEHGG